MSLSPQPSDFKSGIEKCLQNKTVEKFATKFSKALSFYSVEPLYEASFESVVSNFLLSGLKPSLSMKTLSINNFTAKLLSKFLSDLKGGKKFGSKVTI